jgi:hypothetical protein
MTISGLPLHYDKFDLQRLFNPFGWVDYTKILIDPITGLSRVNMTHRSIGQEQMAIPPCAQLQITNPTFGHMRPIPRQYMRDGANINPQLDISGTPSTAKCLAVIVEDADNRLKIGSIGLPGIYR